MSSIKRLSTPLTDEAVLSLKMGDDVLISGVIYTGRDAAHKRLFDILQAGGELPVDLRGQIIYYVGPAPAKPGHAIGPAGPTTSYRMDAYTPRLLEYGLKGMIGKGNRSHEVIEAIKKYKAVYFAAIGGAAALIAKSIHKAEVVAYDDLGPEAIRRLEVVDFPAVVINDCMGNDLYVEGERRFKL
ncbi:MAG TPA: Fe-S-containing hydro-lyase [Candidatus Sumerlaeota bacterium]|nr:MAG: Fumarate hydratase class I, anaerobic [candidate division BRC1 bacterium ADurb.Bin183]HOE62753.1 Fe-S-containing hydro-lyase [Candidatus Sumerlaeota bacterium]HRR29719.1 Fe-S-containing hydro-lyase [Candidatus Sumerlaeia bacterium]HON50387.1 Fe-S-containing hydro-lyase [Candidatus Sumerlaeota bacterium]HOR63603.1 Fe-S-containing hydro-lyase [Candidatus Sumerlaeota bacterium]